VAREAEPSARKIEPDIIHLSQSFITNRKFPGMYKLLSVVTAVAVFGSTVSAVNAQSADAPAHNAAFELWTTSGASPQTLSEMLTCSAVWERWNSSLLERSDRKFTDALRKELSSGNAKKRKIYWERVARREMDEDDDSAYFDEQRSTAEEYANKLTTAYRDQTDKGMQNLMEWLAICK
jgi:hypothetical protein